MKAIRLLFPLVLISIGATSAYAATPTHTYFLHINGNKALGDKLAAELMSRDCYTLRDVSATPAAESMSVGGASSQPVTVDPATSQAAPGECHAFKVYSSLRQLKGKDTSNNYLLKVRIDAQKNAFNLQMFKRDGNDIRRILNAGNFTPKGDFLEAMVQTTKGITFK